MLRFTYLVSVDFFLFFSLCNEYFRKRGSSSSSKCLRFLTPVLKVQGTSLPFVFKSLNLQMGASPSPSEGSLLAAVNHQGRLCCTFRNVMGTKSLGLGRGGGALHFQSRWSFRDKVIMLIIPRSFFLPLN